MQVRSSIEAWADANQSQIATGLAWLSLLFLEGFLVTEYVLLAEVRVTNPLVLIYPFVWINVGTWAVLRTTPPSTNPRRRLLAATIVAGYFVVLAYFGGLLSIGMQTAANINVHLGLPPGIAPVWCYLSHLLG